MQHILCAWCGKEATVPTLSGGRATDRRYCSAACRLAYNDSPAGRARYAERRKTYRVKKRVYGSKAQSITIVCAWCGKEVTVPRKGNRRKYCSKSCRRAYFEQPEKQATYRVNNREKRLACSRAWYDKNRRPYTNANPDWRKGRTPWNKGKTAGDDPRIAAATRKAGLARRGKPFTPARPLPVLRGPANPRWKGGISKDNAEGRTSREYKEWRLAVYRRDHFTCQNCGVKAHGKGTLVAHHIKSWHEFPALRYSTENGTTLCRPCHAIIDDWIRTNTRGWTVGPHEPRVKGEKHGNAKLTEVQAREIHARRAQGVSLAALAAQYNVSSATICDLLKGRTWKHLLPAVILPGRLSGGEP